MQPDGGAAPSVSTRTADFAPRDLPLAEAAELPRTPVRARRRVPRLRDALRRWFEQEL